MQTDHARGDARPKPSALIVDDESSVRAMLVELLSGAGFECVEACDGEEALKLLGERGGPGGPGGKGDADARFGLAVLDLALPGISGAELAWRMREESPGLPLVALSGKLEEWDPDDLKDLGFARIFAKPMDCDEFVSYCRDLSSGGPGSKSH